jgi:hypothetical protein
MTVRTIGVDPGSVHHALCQMGFRGFVLAQSEDGEFIKTPDLTIERWELWDLKRLLRYKAGADAVLVRESLGVAQPMGDTSLSENMALFVKATPWLCEPDETGALVTLSTELQCGHIKNGQLDILLLSHLLPCAMRTLDGAAPRRVLSAARKYGIPHDGALSYDGRKARSVEIMSNLLRLRGEQRWLDFLDAVKHQQRIDYPKRWSGDPNHDQVHDLTDAALLALQTCIDTLAEREKRPLASPEEQETLLKVAAALTAKERAARVNAAFAAKEEKEKKKHEKAKPATPRKRAAPTKRKADQEPATPRKKPKGTYPALEIVLM